MEAADDMVKGQGCDAKVDRVMSCPQPGEGIGEGA